MAQIQLFPRSSVQVEIEKLKNIGSKTRALSTVRGKILDRYGNMLAHDIPTYGLNIDYQLSQYWDPNVCASLQLLADRSKKPDARKKTDEFILNKLEEIRNIMDMCDHFGFKIIEIQQKIEAINKDIWDMRYYLAWKNKTLSESFEEAVPDPNERMLMAYNFRTPAMYESYPLFELKTNTDVFTAQLEFMDIEGIEVASNGKRFYPYYSVAAQTIGWVGGVPKSNTLFKDDELMSYLPEESCGRIDGVEYACEPFLRGRRGEVYIDIDEQLISRTEPRNGGDVTLTLDIELQKTIERQMESYEIPTDSDPNIATVVIDVESGDILVLASIPSYDNNRTRYDWAKLNDPNLNPDKPYINRALNGDYPPGSVVKPLILIAGMEEKFVNAKTIISCPAHDPNVSWPKCWIWKDDHSSHDIMWGNNNNARNAIKGSCNIYFSHVADMLSSSTLQRWLYSFGYGHKILTPPIFSEYPDYSKNLRVSPGRISTGILTSENLTLEEMPPIADALKKLFGIGQSELRVTPLQAANSMATLARGGVYMNPRLFRDKFLPESEKIPLNLSQETLDTVYDGMYAVVNERNGTAYKQFSGSLNSLKEQDVKVYGKTGSTQDPEHAWFGGFATDSSGKKIAFATIVEGGQHGSRDAAPLMRDIIQFCIDAGYVGNK